MKKPIRYLICLLAYMLGVFALGKLGFMLYNHASYDYTFLDTLLVWWNGLSLDLAAAAYLLIVPWAVCLVAVWCPRLALRRLLTPYFALMGLMLTIVIAMDTVLYEHWQFKLDSSIYNYFNLNNGAAESVNTLFIIGALLALILLTSLIAVPAIRLTPRSFRVEKRPGKPTPASRRSFASVGMVLVGMLILLTTYGAREQGRMSVGSAYWSEHLFLNHSAVNPLYSLIASTSRMDEYGQQFRYFSNEEATSTFSPLYTGQDTLLTDTLLRTQRPQIIAIQLESFCAKFVEELGGIPGVCPNLSRFIKEGVLFDQCYANSFRTDRGTVSAQAGHLSYPTVTLMRNPELYANLPSLARSLHQIGYSTSYTYGGDINIMGKRQYMLQSGFGQLISEPDFHLAPGERSTWGVRDSMVLAQRAADFRRLPMDSLWYAGVQTLDSHEPFEVPYQRLEDPVLNAFAYTDHCLGQFVDSLRHTPLWDNLLIVIYSDHGIMYEQTYENPEFFHIPLIWLGGAIREPHRIHTLMNQSDIAATLLAQLGLPVSEYEWSRNVLSPSYTYPFAYCTYPSGLMYKDGTGTTIYDTNADRLILQHPCEGAGLRLLRAKSILQKSYDRLQEVIQKK